MITIEGKTVLTELAELVDPAHTALVMVDMQCDFIEPDGLFGSLGIDLSMYRDRGRGWPRCWPPPAAPARPSCMCRTPRCPDA